MCSTSVHKARIRGHDLAAGFTRAQFLAAIELAESRKEIFLNVFQLEVSFVERVVARITEPEQSVLGIGICAFAFDDQSQRAFFAHGAVRNFGRVQIHVPRAQLHIDRFPIFLNAHGNVAFELVKEFFGLIVVVIFAGIGAGYNHHDVIAALDIKILVAHRRLEQITVFFDPSREVEGFRYWHEVKVQTPPWRCTYFACKLACVFLLGQLTNATPMKIATAQAAVHQPKSVM